MPQHKYKMEYVAEITKIAEADTVLELHNITGFSYDKIQKKIRYGDKRKTKGIISITRNYKKRERKDYNNYKKKPDIIYSVKCKDETVKTFKKLREGAEILGVSITSMSRILKNEEQKNKYNITIV